MSTPVQENLVSKNKQYASSFSGGSLAAPPAKKYAVVTCMDARIDPAAAFGISLGDAHVIRNAGGNARDALRSLVISEQMLGTTEVLVIKHSGCGMLSFTNEDAHAVVEKNLGTEARKELAGLDFQPFAQLEQAVEDDVNFLKACKAIPDSVKISGWVYEVETGKLRFVV
ncbi:MAG: hypothetical protein LQ347_005401 [Umbilicaria vellea]|nr:MAG: hypothetical protein LQ347_005401 [Umbilicaria vellea]